MSRKHKKWQAEEIKVEKETIDDSEDTLDADRTMFDDDADYFAAAGINDMGNK